LTEPNDTILGEDFGVVLFVLDVSNVAFILIGSNSAHCGELAADVKAPSSPVAVGSICREKFSVKVDDSFNMSKN